MTDSPATNGTAAVVALAYRSPEWRGDRGQTAREQRHKIAAMAATRRARRHPAIGETYFGAEVITPHAIDGIHAAPTTQRMFGPRDAHADRMALARDCTRRAYHFDFARIAMHEQIARAAAHAAA